MKNTLALILPGFLLTVNLYSQTTPEEAITASKAITTENFFRYLGVLASDSLEGRDVGSKGYNKAADYIVENIEKLGLQPGGQGGTYFQPVPFETRKINSSSVVFRFKTENNSLSGVFGSDITLLANVKSANITMDSRVVFAGYGLEIPELGINDFEGIDVKGKTVIIAFGVPDGFDKKKYSRYVNPMERIKFLEKKGVSGVILYVNLGVLQNLIFKSIHGFFKEPYFDFKEADISNTMISSGSELLAYSKKEFMEKIFKLNGLNLKKTVKTMEKGQFKAFELNSGLELAYTSTVKDIMCKNIVAILPGSDPELKSEYVILSAHLDHLGIGKPVKNDSIYNGAWDNASGASTLLAVAEAYHQLPVAPKRSVIFLWVTGEEKGLLGSKYFAVKPTLPANKMVADMSLDMAGGIFDAKDIIPMGYKMSNLSQAVDFACKTLNIEEDTTSALEGEYFERSDHYSFVSQGIPALLIFGGMNAVDPKVNGLKTYKNWEKKTYHHPSDDMNQKFFDVAFLKGIQVHFLTSWYIANEMDKVTWNKESAQYKRFLGK